jgi:hypothetical protein
MLVLELLLVWFALSSVAAFAFGALIRAGHGPEPSAPPVRRIAWRRRSPDQRDWSDPPPTGSADLRQLELVIIPAPTVRPLASSLPWVSGPSSGLSTLRPSMPQVLQSVSVRR